MLPYRCIAVLDGVGRTIVYPLLPHTPPQSKVCENKLFLVTRSWSVFDRSSFEMRLLFFYTAAKSSHQHQTNVVLKQDVDPSQRGQGFLKIRQKGSARVQINGFNTSIQQIPLPEDWLTEETVDSWCTYEKCAISPRTYYYVSENEQGFTTINICNLQEKFFDSFFPLRKVWF